MSDPMLTIHLRELEQLGLIYRKEYALPSTLPS